MGSGCIYIAVLYFIHAFVNGRDLKPILIVFPEDGGEPRQDSNKVQRLVTGICF